MPITAGSKLSFYEIVAPIGAGAMGEVWRAKDTKLGREVAIKVLPEHFAADEERRRRFEREAKTLATLNHPNVAQIFGVDQIGETCFLVLELVPGESLEERLQRGALPVADALAVASQIAEGLEAAHEASVIHRDLKPANVRITPDGKVKVLDFGLAKPVREGHEGSTMDSVLTTEAGRLLGTPTYMAPEQARGKSIDKRVDIWAFGCVLYECLTAKRAFAGDTLTDVFAAVLEREPDWSKLPAATPPRVRELLQRCFAKDPRARLRDIGEARLLLGGGAPSADAPPRARAGALAAVALLAFVCGAGGMALWCAEAAAFPGPGAFQKLSVQRDAIFRAAFAPDGRTVVYSTAIQGNTPELYTVRPGSPEPQPLGLKETQLLGISSKGEMAVLVRAEFIGHRLFRGTLARVPMEGGAPRELLEDVREADWSPDGNQLAIIRQVGGKDRLEYPIGKVLAESAGYLSDLRFSPRGDRIAYFEHPWRWDDRGSVNVVDLVAGTRVLADGFWGLEGIAWTPDGREILFSASEGGLEYQVFAVDLEGVRRAALKTPGGLTIQDVDRKGRWLTTRDSLRGGLMVHLAGDAEDRDLSWLDATANGILAQDGRTIVFVEQAASVGSNYAVCMRKTDGSAVTRLGEGGPLDLSRDGKWVLAHVPSTPPKLMLYPTGPGEPRQLERGNLERYSGGSWFRDGSAVLIEAAEPGRATRFYVQEVAGGPPRPVTPEGTSGGRLSPDARSILARGPSGAFFTYPIAGGEAKPQAGLVATDGLIHWSADGRSVLAAREGQVPMRIERVDLETGRREPLCEIPSKDLKGVQWVYMPMFTDDEQSYCYAIFGSRSELFVSEDAR